MNSAAVMTLYLRLTPRPNVVFLFFDDLTSTALSWDGKASRGIALYDMASDPGGNDLAGDG